MSPLGLTQDGRPSDPEMRRRAVLGVLFEHASEQPQAPKLWSRTIEARLGWAPGTTPPVLVALDRAGLVKQWRIVERPSAWEITPEGYRYLLDAENIPDVKSDSTLTREGPMGWYDDDDDELDEVDAIISRDDGSHPLRNVRWIHAFLDQDEAWVGSNRRNLQIADMTPGHALMALRHLLRNALDVTLVAWIADPGRIEVENTHLLAEARLWLMARPLTQALLRRARSASREVAPWAR